MTAIALQLLWISAHHGRRQRAIPHDPRDAAPYPRLAWHSQMWGYVHDITAALGHPVAPSRWAIR